MSVNKDLATIKPSRRRCPGESWADSGWHGMPTSKASHRSCPGESWGDSGWNGMPTSKASASAATHTYTVRRLGMGKHRIPATGSWGACQRGDFNEPRSFHLPMQRKGASAAPCSKESAWNAGDAGDTGSIPGSERSPGGGYGNPLQYSCWKKSMDRRAWQASVYGVTNSWTHLKHGMACHIQREALNSLHWATLFFLIKSNLLMFWLPDLCCKNLCISWLLPYLFGSGLWEWSEILCPRLKSSVLMNNT